MTSHAKGRFTYRTKIKLNFLIGALRQMSYVGYIIYRKLRVSHCFLVAQIDSADSVDFVKTVA